MANPTRDWILQQRAAVSAPSTMAATKPRTPERESPPASKAAPIQPIVAPVNAPAAPPTMRLRLNDRSDLMGASGTTSLTAFAAARSERHQCSDHRHLVDSGQARNVGAFVIVYPVANVVVVVGPVGLGWFSNARSDRFWLSRTPFVTAIKFHW
jgi:hypothetical protein